MRSLLTNKVEVESSFAGLLETSTQNQMSMERLPWFNLAQIVKFPWLWLVLQKPGKLQVLQVLQKPGKCYKLQVLQVLQKPGKRVNRQSQVDGDRVRKEDPIRKLPSICITLCIIYILCYTYYSMNITITITCITDHHFHSRPLPSSCISHSQPGHWSWSWNKKFLQHTMFSAKLGKSWHMSR